jgi:hypothetical protein
LIHFNLVLVVLMCLGVRFEIKMVQQMQTGSRNSVVNVQNSKIQNGDSGQDGG